MLDKTFIEVNRDAKKIPYNADERKNALLIEMRLCADARKGECPYYVKVHVNSDFVSFNQGFCAYGFRKDKKD